MGTVDPNSGDFSYLKVISQKVADNLSEFQLFREQVYLMMGTAKLKNFELYNVATAADLPTPTLPAIGFTQDTQSYWAYSGGWKLIGLVLP